MGKTVSMPRAEFVREHKHLAKVLEGGTVAQRKMEAAKQRQELKGHEKKEGPKHEKGESKKFEKGESKPGHRY